jgi:hypothetical protein
MPVDYGPLPARGRPSKPASPEGRGADPRVLPIGHVRAFMVGARLLGSLNIVQPGVFVGCVGERAVWWAGAGIVACLPPPCPLLM